MFDCAIIGSGPAGVSAALTLKALNKNIIWFGSKKLSVKIKSAEKIRNYPGLPNVSGIEMQEAFQSQITEMGIEITEKIVTGVYNMGDYYGILFHSKYELNSWYLFVIIGNGIKFLFLCQRRKS